MQKGQVNSHVAIYLGDHLFLHDHGQSDTGGVHLMRPAGERKQTERLDELLINC